MEGKKQGEAADARKQIRRREEEILDEVLRIKSTGSRGQSFDEGFQCRLRSLKFSVSR